jgi:hypothetical protein
LALLRLVTLRRRHYRPRGPPFCPKNERKLHWEYSAARVKKNGTVVQLRCPQYARRCSLRLRHRRITSEASNIKRLSRGTRVVSYYSIDDRLLINKNTRFQRRIRPWHQQMAAARSSAIVCRRLCVRPPPGVDDDLIRKRGDLPESC